MAHGQIEDPGSREQTLVNVELQIGRWLQGRRRKLVDGVDGYVDPDPSVHQIHMVIDGVIEEVPPRGCGPQAGFKGLPGIPTIQRAYNVGLYRSVVIHCGVERSAWVTAHTAHRVDGRKRLSPHAVLPTGASSLLLKESKLS